MKQALITGGLGFIGSHVCLELLKSGYSIIIIDDLSNSSRDKLDLIKSYSEKNYNTVKEQIIYYEFNLTNYEKLKEVFENNKIDVVIHLAGYKAVSESIMNPIMYYENNIISTLNLVKIMELYKVWNLIFSSSATVYGNVQTPYSETSQTGIGITNPYGRSKYFQEEILKDLSISNNKWNIIILRYFNPIGHINSDFKENPNGIPNNLFPFITKVYNGDLDYLRIFGSDYNTRDGTCLRDFIHVVDLANSHTVCSNYITNNNCSLKIYNVGTGNNCSVLELINAFEKENNTKICYKMIERRSGDIESSYSNVDLIYNELGWKTKYNINDSVKLV